MQAAVRALSAEAVEDLFEEGKWKRRLSNFGRGLKRNLIPRLGRPLLSDEASLATEAVEEPDETQSTTEPTSKCHRFIHFIASLKLQFFFFLYTLAFTLHWTASTYLIATKACLSDNSTDKICKEILNEESLDKKHHKGGGNPMTTVELFAIYQSLVAFVPGALITLWLGSWCDASSNFKAPIFVSIMGSIVSCTCSLVSSFYPNSSIYYDLLTPIPETLTGGLPIVLMAAYTLVAASVASSRRTTAFFLLQISFLLAFAFGRLTGALVMKRYGLLPMYVTAICVFLVVLVYALLLIDQPDMYTEEEQRQRRRRRHYGSSGANTDPILLSTRIFSHHHALASLRNLIQQRVQGTRYELMFLMVTVFLLVANSQSSPFSYFYGSNNSSSRSFEGDMILSSVLILLSILLLIPLFVVIVKLIPWNQDYTMTTIGIVCLLAGQMFTLSSSPGFNYVSSVLRTISNIAPACIRAHVANIVERKQLGKAFGVMAACEAVAPIFGRAISGRFLHLNALSNLPISLLLIGPLAFLGIGWCRTRGRAQLAMAVDDES